MSYCRFTLRQLLFTCGEAKVPKRGRYRAKAPGDDVERAIVTSQVKTKKSLFSHLIIAQGRRVLKFAPAHRDTVTCNIKLYRIKQE